MSKQLQTFVALIVLFAVSFLVLNWIYGYVIVFQSETNDCFFLFGRPFFEEFLDHPAGPVRYAGRFLAQFYHIRWLGALVIAACIACFGFLFHGVVRKLNRTVPLSQTLLPCVLLLALHTSTMWLLQDTLGVCTSCVAFLGYLSLPGTVTKRVYAFAATPIAYFVAGTYVWIFVAWVIASECRDSSVRSGLLFVAAYMLFSISVPLVAWRWWFMIPLRSALICPVQFGPPFRIGSGDQTSAHFAIDCGLAVGLLGTLLLIPYWNSLFSGTSLAMFWHARSDRRTRAALTFAVGILLILLHLVRYEAPLAEVIAVRQLYKARKWDALLERARQNPYGDHRIQFMTNFALCQQGKLLDEMFSYRQPWGTRGLFMNFSGMRVASAKEDDTRNGMYNSDLLYELGHANFSLRHAYNCITMQGRTDESLARMAECSIVNGNYATATKYLNLLERTLFYRAFARHYKEVIADPAAVKREFGELRARLPKVDGSAHPTAYFVTLLESKPDNRQALDYLMAWLLLDRTPESMESLCLDIGHFRDVGRTTIPRHCQEAMLLKERFSGQPVDPQGFVIDKAIMARVEKFEQDFSGQGGWRDAKTARNIYGDSYMFYWFFATVPKEVGAAARPGGYGATSRQE